MLTLLTLILAVGPLETAPLPRRAPLTTVRTIRNLSPDEAAAKHPVRITGVVTYAGTVHKDLFVQDAREGIYLKQSEVCVGFAAGEGVEVEGVTDDGGFAPCVIPLKITRISKKLPSPTPLPFTMTPEDARWLDGQYVQVWGVVASVTESDLHTVIAIYNSHGRAQVHVPQVGLAKNLQSLVNSAVSIKAVCVPSFDPRDRTIRLDATRLYTNTMPWVSVMMAQPLESQAIDHLLRFSPDPHPGARRVIITGVVIGFANNGTFYVQDPTGGLAVVPEPPLVPVKFGDKVRVTGLVSIEGRRIRMNRATVENLGAGDLPEPVPISLTVLVRNRPQVSYTVTQGRVEDVIHRDDGTLFTMVDGAARLNAFAPVGTTVPAGGSRIEARGVLGSLVQSGSLPTGLIYWLHSPADLTLIEAPHSPPPPTWWTTERILGALLIPAALAGLAFIWVFTLRRQVQQQTEELRVHFEMQSELEEKLRTSQKLEAIGRLAGGIAHDFNNLLTVINGCGELLVNDLPADSQQRELARDIRSAGERAASLVSQLLLFSRRQTVRLHELDLRPTVREAERILRRVIGETIRVVCTVASNVPVVRAEATLIHQILLNLAVNARDAMPIGGTLAIDVDAHGTTARIRVSDTGIGMDEETRKRIFEPFFTTKAVGQGTGLGLATVYGIVQTLEGQVECHSEIGKGTTFEITLPALDSSQPQLATGSASRAVTAGRGTILVCEDDDAVRELTSRILESAGYSVLVAETTTDAARLAQTHPGPIGLLLTDMVMPEMNGRELADLVQPLRPNMRVLYMTGYTDDEMVRQGVATNEIELIGKPFNAAMLTAKINEMLTRADEGAVAGMDSHLAAP